MTHPNEISPVVSHQAKQEVPALAINLVKWTFLLDHITPIQEEAVGAHAKPWKNEIDALHRDVRALHPNVQDMDCLFCSNNPLSSKVATVSLPIEFEVLKEMFEGRRDPRAHLM
ncbi:hypothetical protein PVK06_033733 [Gossypium arboreum]|uniref:Uncharacterized protein n=1 Tax=Gossypium arboreum TaxID=29729 RepID=A0ABR0NF48_GOSAR|nr:hypothetical protein PVK06_033733 [Gossypium arboreum]